MSESLEIRIQIREFKETIDFHQEVLDRGVEFQNGFDKMGNPETNLTIAKRIIANTKEELKKYSGESYNG
tara:strand:+ start:209 stop:418 length:210 start_codon:yes stop_codon:yes gene_type:complete